MAYTVFAMGFVLVLPRAEPLIRSLSISQISFLEFWRMWASLYPMVFYLEMPLIVAFSIGFVYLLMARDKELVIAFGAGTSPLRVVWPGIIAAMIGAAICALLSLYLLPIAMQDFKNMTFIASKRLNSKSLESGKFNKIYGGCTLYFENRDAKGYMRNVILWDNSKPQVPVFIVAKGAVLEIDRQDISLLLYNGSIQKPSARTRKIVLLDFKAFQYPIGKAVQFNTAVGRAWGFFERNIGMLLDPPRSLKLSPRERAAWVMEGNKRIINPIMCLGYGIVTIGFIGWASTRVRNVYWVIPFALAGILGFHGFYIVFMSSYVKYSLDLPAILYSVPIAVLCDGALLLYLLTRQPKPRQYRGKKSQRKRQPLAVT